MSMFMLATFSIFMLEISEIPSYLLPSLILLFIIATQYISALKPGHNC